MMDLSFVLLFLFCLAESKAPENFSEKYIDEEIGVPKESSGSSGGLNSIETQSHFYKNMCSNIKGNNNYETLHCFALCKIIEMGCSEKKNGFEQCVIEELNKEKNAETLLRFGCKLPSTGCEYSEWSKWSKCSKECLSNDYFPTKYRTRKVIGDKGINCDDSDELRTIQFEICADLPPCKSIKTSIEISNGKWLKGSKKGKETDLDEWMKEALDRHPELFKLSAEYDEEDEKNNKYQIMKSVKNIGILSNTCGCRSGYAEVSFTTFIQSEKMKTQLKELCMLNKYNQIVFKGNRNYIYYCLNNMMLKGLQDRTPTCEESENTEYVACKKIYEEGTEWILSMMYEGLNIMRKFFDKVIDSVFEMTAYLVLGGFIIWLVK